MFTGKVIHQDFLNSSFGRHWSRGGSRPQIPLWDDQQHSKPQLSILWLSYINVSLVSSILLFTYCCFSCCRCCLMSQAFSSWTTCDPHHTGLGFKFQTVVCTLCIMCDVPSITVYCGESTECFLGVASRFFLKPLVNIPVPAIILHFKLHVHCITIHKILYFGFLPFARHFCLWELPRLSVCMFSLLFLIMSGLFSVSFLSVCTAWFHYTVIASCSYTGLGMCVYHLSVVSMPRALHIE